jgi:hypothetical protein
MTNEYRIEPVGSLFIVVDPWGEIVNRCSTEEAARQDIERCEREDAMWETAKLMVDTAVKAHMRMHGVDRETSRRLLQDAVEVTD